jgi:hypothetical protein
MLAAASPSKLMVPPLTFTMQQRRLQAGQSSSRTAPGSTPKLAILPQTVRSPLILHTFTLLQPRHSESGCAAWASGWYALFFRPQPDR